MHGIAFLSWACLILQTPASIESDPRAEVTAAVDEFRATVDEAAAELSEAIEQAIETTRRRRRTTTAERLAAVNDLERQRELFEQEAVVPESSSLRGASTRYRRSVEQATTRLDRAIKTVVDEHIRAGEQDEANDLYNLRNLLVIGPGHELVGTWQLQEGRGSHGYLERFVIEKEFGHWSVQRTFIDASGRTVGKSTGSDFSHSSETLNYTENYRRKPNATWDDRCAFTGTRAEGSDGLSVRWQTPGGQVGTISLVRAE